MRSTHMSPEFGREARPTTWKQLRDETEDVLLTAARAGECEVIVKCHPQQDQRAESARLAREAGSLWHRGFSIAKADADTRRLIVTSDAVVGFQTTALYEAVAARKAVVYAAWGKEYESLRERLIPFEDAPEGCLHHASSAPDLVALLQELRAAPGAACAAWYETAIGHIDGHATERVATRLETVAAGWPAGAERHELDLGRRRFAAKLLARSVAAEAVWTIAIPVAEIAGQQQRVARRRAQARQARGMAAANLRQHNDEP